MAGAGGASTPASTSPALPAFFELAAPRHWRAIDFISDLHLSPALPRTLAAWAGHLRNTSADAVFILGDLFEVWVGDDSRDLPFERHCVDVLADASSRRHVAFMVGNRDFLLGAAMLKACGVMALPDPTVLTAWGQRILLSHGDALCLNDTAYQTFRSEVRAAAWQAAFLGKPLTERLRIAAEIRQVSESRRRFDGDSGADIDAGAAVGWMHAMGTAEMVHGHTHRPGSSTLAPGFKRHVLSDWDLDSTGADPTPRAEVLRLTRDGFERRPPATAVTPR
jgi:UDP-2,3-diacylglucosamine hydrolase